MLQTYKKDTHMSTYERWERGGFQGLSTQARALASGGAAP